MNTENFKFSHPIQPRWNDMDAIGHVNNIYYFEYFQIARGYYMPTVSKQWDWYQHMFVIANISCDYYKEINLKVKNLSVKIRTTHLSAKSFEMEYLIVSESADKEEIIHAKGKSINVMFDMKSKKSIEIPEWLRMDIIAYEPGM